MSEISFDNLFQGEGLLGFENEPFAFESVQQADAFDWSSDFGTLNGLGSSGTSDSSSDSEEQFNNGSVTSSSFSVASLVPMESFINQHQQQPVTFEFVANQQAASLKQHQQQQQQSEGSNGEEEEDDEDYEHEEKSKSKAQKRKRARPYNAPKNKPGIVKKGVLKSAGILMSEEELLAFNSSEIEDYIAEKSSQYSLSPAQLKSLKHVRRLIKNREYAQSSRDKKKQEAHQVQSQIDKLETERKNLKARVAQLEQDNKRYQSQLEAIATAAKSDQVLMDRLKRANTPSSALGDFLSSLKSRRGSVTATLFIVVLGFGLFAMAPTAAIGTSASVGQQSIQYSTGRGLKEADTAVVFQPHHTTSIYDCVSNVLFPAFTNQQQQDHQMPISHFHRFSDSGVHSCSDELDSLVASID